jgi:hypothetical protein
VATKPEVLVILERLRCSYQPAPAILPETLEIYAELLSEFPAELLAQAAIVLAKTSKWFPAISELRAAVLEISGERAQIPAVGEAWIEARRGAARFDTYDPPTESEFTHPVVYRAAVQAAGGWRRWCLSEDEAALRARFFEVYRELRERELVQATLPESARHLTAEESRYLLEDLEARAAKELPGGSEERRRRELSPLVAPDKARAIVGERMTDEEFAARKAELLKRLDA